MSLLLPADPGTRWTRTTEPWVAGPSSYSLDLVGRIILILELRDELWGRGILTEKFLAEGRSRTAQPWIAKSSSYPLDHEVLVERIILDLPDKVWSRGALTDELCTEVLAENILSPNPWPWNPWWVMNGSISRKYSKSKSLTLTSLTLVVLELLLFIKLGSPLS